jgi:hypothetical protein
MPIQNPRLVVGISLAKGIALAEGWPLAIVSNNPKSKIQNPKSKIQNPNKTRDKIDPS